MKNKNYLKKKEELRRELFQARLEEKLLGKTNNEKVTTVKNKYKENLLLLNS